MNNSRKLKRISDGIYKDTVTGFFYERPWLHGRRTWRKLNGRNLKLAKEDFQSRRTDQKRAARGMARDPYAPPLIKISQILSDYSDGGCPNRSNIPKQGRTLDKEISRIKKLGSFWGTVIAESATPRECHLYATRRRKEVKKGCDGGRAIDIELVTLSNALDWAVATGKLLINPLKTRPRFHGKVKRHCRECRPLDANELHALAAHLFEVRESEVLGWQYLLEAMTGCRSSEIVRLRWDAKQGGAGHIAGNYLWLERSKSGVNPFVMIHPALDEALTQLRRWHSWRYPQSPWMLPGRGGSGAVCTTALTAALKRASGFVAAGHRTSHGARAYYVTVRRSQGISDGQIASEIGDKSGAAIVTTTYGDIPPNWQGMAQLTWMPEGSPAWSVLEMPENLLQISGPPHGIQEKSHAVTG